MESVKRLRREAGLSQERLAALAGVNKVTLVHLETGKTNPNVETLEKLARALECEVADFFPKVQAPLPLFEEQARQARLGDVASDRQINVLQEELERLYQQRQAGEIDATGYQAAVLDTLNSLFAAAERANLEAG